MSDAYKVIAYSIENFSRILVEKAETSEHVIDEKRHLDYFDEYFNVVSAKTIVVENDYVDRDYLEDYAAYYVRCFQSYNRYCTRLHFFEIEFTEPEFEELLGGSQLGLQASDLQNAYLGFIVIKPLPQTVIGRTCLKPYPGEGRRHFPITRPYHSSLFGIPLSINSPAFQEQDSVAAACATSALWSAFQGTGMQFQHSIPSPVEITRAATAHVPHQSRTFPESNGLTITQMSDAIRSVGLEPFIVNATDEFVLKSAIYAYLRGGIPVILVIALIDPEQPGVDQGYHAVTVTGYSLGTQDIEPDDKPKIRLKASQMDKIYAHDDQIGPFARMEFLGDSTLSTSWLNESDEELQAKASIALVPLYHKIRIPLEKILEMVFTFDSLVASLRADELLDLDQSLEWDVFLTDTNTLKNELRSANNLGPRYRARLLTNPLPRFLWRATAIVNDTPLLDLIFDATDIEQGCFFACAIDYDREFTQTLRELAGLLLQLDDLTLPERRLYEWYSKSETTVE